MSSISIGAGKRCFVIAEAGVNHNGDLSLAKKLVRAAKQAGADAVKFQTFKAERLVTRDAPKADYQIRTTGGTESQYAMLKRLELSESDHRVLMTLCVELDILFLSTPFDELSADLLDKLGVTAFKLPSGEVTNLPFLSHVARKRKPVLLSTGMSSLAEVKQAVAAIRKHNKHLVLLHCVSNYPAAPADVNLRAMITMDRAFRVPVGYSDHTMGLGVALAAVALGARVIEKHLTLDRSLRGPDHQASLEPDEFKALVEGIRTVEAALGNGRKEPAASEAATRAVARKSLVAAAPIRKGDVLNSGLVAVRRPGTGLSPAMLGKIIGKKVKRDIADGTLLKLEMFA